MITIIIIIVINLIIVINPIICGNYFTGPISGFQFESAPQTKSHKENQLQVRISSFSAFQSDDGGTVD